MRKNVMRLFAVAMALAIEIANLAPMSAYAMQTTMVDTDMTVSANGAVSGNEIETFGEDGKLNYLYLDSNYIETPGNEIVMVSFGDENTLISEATLVVENYETKEKQYFSSDDTMGNMVLFDISFKAEDRGVYEAVAVSVTTDDGQTKYVQFSKTGMENVYFGVDVEVFLSEEAPVVLNEEIEQIVETQIVTFDEGDAADTESEEIINAVEDALDEAENNVTDTSIDLELSMAQTSMYGLGSVSGVPTTTSNGNFVVVIDPGHDGTHAGARANGLKEEELTLKIANYCKAELEKYAGVTVYMTRSGSACPYPGTTSTVCNKNRVNYAQSVGADVYVSIHLNSASNASANGAEVFYPNASYNASIGQEGANLANKIMRQLAALGLSNRGIAIRNSEDNTLYPDGSLADYYGVIKNSKLAGFPAVIVEHAFLTNASDAAFLSGEDNLKKLGVADATGIVEYYGLDQKCNIKFGSLTIKNVDNVSGSFTVSLTGVSPVADVKNIRIAVWSEENGQDDLIWYTIPGNGTSTYTKDIKVTKGGKYQVHVYATDVYGSSKILDSKTCVFTAESVKVGALSIALSRDENTATVSLANVQSASEIRIGVWSEKNGQDDLIWYRAKNTGNGTWTTSVPLSSHNYIAGNYQVHVYGVNAYENKLMRYSTFAINGPSVGSVKIDNVNQNTGTFRVKVNNVIANRGLSEVKVAIWSGNNQNNLKWYVAQKQSDGSYTVNVDIANHSYQYGLYQAHAYAVDVYGNSGFAYGTVEMKQPVAVIGAVGNSNQSQFNIKASNVGYAGGVKGVRIAVWSEAGGQDDLVWYTAENKGSGVWSANAIIAKHKTAGKYNAHMYITDVNGDSHFGGYTTFNVSGPKGGKIEVTDIDSAAGTYTVNVSNIQSERAIEEVRVAVWSGSTQKNLRWYIANKNSDGSYSIRVNIANHDYQYGVYQVHAYLTDTSGISKCIATQKEIKQPVSVVTATANDNQSQFNIKASNVGYAGGVKGVRIAVWSEAGGQDDLVWYTAENKGSGVWSANAVIAKHKTAGKYNAHMYITDVNGDSHYGGYTTFNVSGPKGGKIEVTDIDSAAGTYTVNVSNIQSERAIEEVRIAVWSGSTQKNLRWYIANKNSDGSYSIRVNIANHDYQYGVYQVHAYLTDTNGISKCIATQKEIKQPISVVTATANDNQSQFNIKASNVGYAGGVKGVRIAVWSEAGGQDDLVWYTAENKGSGVWSANAVIAKHKTAGKYNAHMYITDVNGNSHYGGYTTFKVSGPKGGTVELTEVKENEGLFTVGATGITAKAGIKEVKVAVWSTKNQSDILWYSATAKNNSYFITADVRNHNNNIGTYNAHVYAVDNNGVEVCLGGVTCEILEVDNLLYPIMGTTSVTVDQMVAYYNSVTTYPSYYANTEAANIKQFCQIYMEECAAEGVKAEVAFVQAMKETNFLRYGGDVDISQFNFAGIGATGGVPGNSFASVRIGIRAHIQHLKAYASTQALNQACVDPRFKYVTRNTAPYCEWLGIKENPYGKGWATAVNYGYNVVERIKNLKKY